MADTMTMRVTRYEPDLDHEPRTQDFSIPLRDNWVVLDGLNYIKDQLDGTLSYRWSCRMGICGSCGMMVDDEPVLTCATFLVDYAPGPIRVEPLANFPVVRDLVVDISDFIERLPRVSPWLVRHEDEPVDDGEYLQTPGELAEYEQYSMCINCMLCYSACPVYGLDPGFIGPAAIALAQRYNLDSRDQGAADRLDVLIHPDGLWGCTFVGECTTACPKDVDPAGAIQRYKLTAAIETLKSYVEGPS
ncbi:succinate dehydrogenase/fumarate reductase iron-sulfur subunit [Jiangella aurantiaca]|uniref:Fumarate reductase iron-sulfur subunit n=1 Tax=Jiangella aurantiaca TaxID=2530373 RepID=A0A4R5ACT0_9ACTN|nr:succinate dehydrogenase/fumarate reductase iron-sulfur subunit [Jiangella aurantiaca]TDD70258.1 succinate dehydrogenase/fumarate reductase iron-sulfur subunit [Jiangella aurantiaca]